jgi:hypothetical protein
MSALVALRMARAAGVQFALDGNDLSLKAASEPPAAVIEALVRHKSEIVALLQPGADRLSFDDWRLFFEERAAIAEFDGGLLRDKAEAGAFESCINEWLNRNPAPSVPGRCAWCGRFESRDAVVLPYGTEPGGHVWLHRPCWTEWHKKRRTEAKFALTRMGIGNFSDGCIALSSQPHVNEASKQ